MSGGFGAIVIAPSYNNAGTIADVIAGIEAVGLDLLVVNDGCTDGTAGILERWLASPGKIRKFVVTHPVNRGKGAGLRTAFAAAAEAGYTHAVAMDTDGQLDPRQLGDLIAIAQRHPDRMVLGVRDEHAPDYPKKSRVGRRVSNFMIRLESGARVEDSQCGMRVYPLDLFRIVKGGVDRFGYETEILTRAAWAGCEFIHAPVRCRYLPEGQRVSHFRPWVDSWRGAFMHAPLVLRAMWPWPHRKWRHVARSRRPREYTLRAFVKWLKYSAKSAIKWLSPAEAYRQLRQDAVAGPALALGLALGVWIANLPLYGFQTLLALYTARRLHLNPLATVVGSQLSTPPIGPILILLAIGIGHVLLHGSWPELADFDVRQFGWRLIGPVLLDWIVGGVLLGFILGAITFFATFFLWKAVHPDEEAQAAT